jgi:hypothetical protein
LIESVFELLTGHQDIEIQEIDEDGDEDVHHEENHSTELQSQLAGQRIYISENKLWQAVAGHEVDPARIPRTEFELLVAIAQHGPEGILQAAATHMTGQDKHSVPARTDRLAKKGYITKTTVMARSIKTSLLRLAKWSSSESGMLENGMIHYDALFDKTIALLKENGGIMSLDDLCKGLQATVKATRKVYRRYCVRLSETGCTRLLRCRVQDEDGNPILIRQNKKEKVVRAVQLLREPTGQDKTAFMSHRSKPARGRREKFGGEQDSDEENIDDDDESLGDDNAELDEEDAEGELEYDATELPASASRTERGKSRDVPSLDSEVAFRDAGSLVSGGVAVRMGEKSISDLQTTFNAAPPSPTPLPTSEMPTPDPDSGITPSRKSTRVRRKSSLAKGVDYARLFEDEEDDSDQDAEHEVTESASPETLRRPMPKTATKLPPTTPQAQTKQARPRKPSAVKPSAVKPSAAKVSGVSNGISVSDETPMEATTAAIGTISDPSTSSKRQRKKSAKAIEADILRAAGEPLLSEPIDGYDMTFDSDDVDSAAEAQMDVDSDDEEVVELDTNTAAQTPNPDNGTQRKKRKFKPRDPNKKREPVVKKREIPPEEFEEYDKYAQAAAQRQVRLEMRTGTKRTATMAELDDTAEQPNKAPRIGEQGGAEGDTEIQILTFPLAAWQR